MSERRSFAFLHNPKCAGTTVRTALSRFDTTGNFFWGFDQWHGVQVDKAHLPLFVIRSGYPDYFRILRRCFTFMFVRNPYQRSISAFNELHQHLFDAVRGEEGGSVSSSAASEYRNTLNRFICSIDPNSLAIPSFNFRHFVRQLDLAYIGHKSFVDLVMKLEEWPKCLLKLQVFLPDVADVLRSAERRHAFPLGGNWADYLQDASIKRINALYDDDFNLFGYEKA